MRMANLKFSAMCKICQGGDYCNTLLLSKHVDGDDPTGTEQIAWGNWTNTLGKDNIKEQEVFIKSRKTPQAENTYYVNTNAGKNQGEETVLQMDLIIKKMEELKNELKQEMKKNHKEMRDEFRILMEEWREKAKMQRRKDNFGKQNH
ncbi:hypothetical protein FQR65_LT10250 [Abscondita terminalis]|nr:hypothetical protein FQR65_LT10250 [Abscondita terminalis]